MKKKTSLIAFGSFLACSTMAIALVATAGGFKLFDKAKGTDDYYSITVEAATITTYTEGSTSGSFTDYTDQLHNPVNFAFEGGLYNESEHTVYLDLNEAGFIYNPYEAGGENEIRSMNSIEVFGYGTFVVYWGYEKAGAIEYTNSGSFTINDHYEFSFEGEKPNYFKLASGSLYSEPNVDQFIIRYDKTCEAGSDPFVIQGGVRYKKRGDHAEVLGLADPLVTNLVIAKQIGGLDVTIIAENAFENEDALESVYIPNTVSKIDDAFRYCDNLATVTFEAGGLGSLSMGGTFNGCASLASLTLPKRAVGYQYNLDNYTLNDTESLAAIAIEDDYDEGYYTVVDNVLYRNNETVIFNYPACRPGASFTVPTTVTDIYDYSMKNLRNLETLVLQNTSKLTFGAYALSWSQKLSNIEFNGSAAVELTWNALREFKGQLILPANTIINDSGLGQLGDGARVFFEATEPLVSWNANWADRKTTDSENVKFYFYSASEPESAAPAGSDGFWHRVGEDNAPRVWSDHITIQSSDDFSKDDTWYAVWAWTKGQDNGAFYYDHNAPVSWLYTIEVPTDRNCFIILRMKPGVDASLISSFPTGQFHNRSDDLLNVALIDATIVQWDNGMGYGNLGITWK